MRSNFCWVILIGSAILNLIADYCAKTWSVNDSKLMFGITMTLWTLTALFYLKLLYLEKSMITTAISWSALSLVSFVIVGYMTGEPMNPKYIAALLCSVIAIILTS